MLRCAVNSSAGRACGMSIFDDDFASTITALAPPPPPTTIPEAELAIAIENSETPVQPELIGTLVSMAEGATEDEAVAVAAWLVPRLSTAMGELTGSTPVTLKILTLLQKMAAASPVFRAAAAGADGMAEVMGTAAQYARVDPVHGEMPAQHVRASAGRLAAQLEAPKELTAGGPMLLIPRSAPR